MNASEKSKFILDEMKLIQDRNYKIWSIYMQWYTWYFGANLLIFGWFATKDVDDLKMFNGNKLFFLLWILTNISGVFVSILVLIHSRTAHQKLKSYVNKIDIGVLTTRERADLIIPNWLSTYAGIANCGALLVTTVVWIQLAHKIGGLNFGF